MKKICIFLSYLIVIGSIQLSPKYSYAEATIDWEQLAEFYEKIIEEAKKGDVDLSIETLTNMINMDNSALTGQGVPLTNVIANKFFALYVRGIIRLQLQGFYNEAIRDFNLAATIIESSKSAIPVAIMVYSFRSDAFYMAGEFKRAADDITKCIAILNNNINQSNPSFLQILYSVRGKYYSANTQNQEAINDFKKAIEMGSAAEFTLWSYAYALDVIKQKDAAKFFFQKYDFSESASDSSYFDKPIALKTKAFIAKRILSASSYVKIPENIVASAEIYSKAYVLKIEDRGLTYRIQNLLKMLGYDTGPIDGQLGTSTRSAIKDFQKDYKIPVDGEATEELYGRLKIIMASASTFREGNERKLEKEEFSIPKIVKDVLPALVLVIGYDNNRITQTGSGFFISKEHIITNNHVIDGIRSIRIKTYDGIFLNARVVYKEPNHDLSLILITERYDTKKKLPISKRTPETGERILAIGHPLGLEQTVSDGIVSALRKKNNVDFVQITAPISPGSSGGPVLDLKGEVIGVSTLFLESGQNLNFAVSAKYLNEIMKRIN